ncbi:hypothetical protein NQD34_014110 [Periophthalmus magnuspinnatus]|nr:hypothetical protein NQD34_014110 [Periophthalmus magnuspinnatus]
MTTDEYLLLYILPVLAAFIGVMLLCLYDYFKKRRGSYNISVAPLHVRTAQPVDGAEIVVDFNSVPPGYSSIDPPPPYALFDPKVTNVWPETAPPSYVMYPISVRMARHLETSDSPSTSHS